MAGLERSSCGSVRRETPSATFGEVSMRSVPFRRLATLTTGANWTASVWRCEFSVRRSARLTLDRRLLSPASATCNHARSAPPTLYWVT